MARVATAESAPRSGAGRRKEQAPPLGLVPFTAAAHEHTEPAFDFTVTPGAASQNHGPFEIPAYGYLRHIWLLVTASGGTLGAGVLDEDAPFNILQSITLSDVNGAPIFGPLDGYEALWANICGGYAFSADPRRAPDYVGTINSQFALRVPVEISHHDGLGSLANQNAASSYKLSLVSNPSTEIFSTAPTTIPAVRVRGYLEAWSLPNETNLAGQPQAQAPPMHATTQYHSKSQKSIAVGENTNQLTRMGNLVRNLIFICRNAAGARVDTVFPDPIRFVWDARTLLHDTQLYRRQVMYERLNNIVTRDAGVFHYAFNHSIDNAVGDDSPTLWLPTVQATRMELVGSSAVAGNIQVITNDVAPAEVIPAERFVETSRTGLHPEVGSPTVGANL